MARSDRTSSTDRTVFNSADGLRGNLGVPNALSFTRANTGRCSIADNASLRQGTTGLSLSCWVNLANINASNVQSLLGKWDYSNQCEYLIQFSGSLNRFRFVCSSTGSGGAGSFTQFPSAVSAGTWVHLACWHTSNNNGVYQNNVKFSGGAPAMVASCTTQFALGGGGTTGTTNCLDGTLLRVGVWPGRAFSDDDVTTLYNDGIPLAWDQMPSALQSGCALFTLDGDGITLAERCLDKSGTGNHLSPSGTGVALATGTGEYWRKAA